MCFFSPRCSSTSVYFYFFFEFYFLRLMFTFYVFKCFALRTLHVFALRTLENTTRIIRRTRDLIDVKAQSLFRWSCILRPNHDINIHTQRSVIHKHVYVMSVGRGGRNAHSEHGFARQPKYVQIAGAHAKYINYDRPKSIVNDYVCRGRRLGKLYFCTRLIHDGLPIDILRFSSVYVNIGI